MGESACASPTTDVVSIWLTSRPDISGLSALPSARGCSEACCTSTVGQAPARRSKSRCRIVADRIRIAIADDHPVVRDGLAAMLETQSDLDVIGQAENGPDAVNLVQSEQPDVLLLDLEMPGLDGVGVLRRLREMQSPTRAIVFTVFDTDDRIIAAVEAGAAGYLLKGAPRS